MSESVLARAATRESIARIGAASSSLFLAAGWLLPNHYLPWPAFHTDAWVAALLALLLWGYVVSGPMQMRLSLLTACLFAIALIPFLHLASGLMALRGDVWVCFAYLIGFSLAVSLGEVWGRYRPEVPVAILLGAVVLAAVVSVGLQLYQWTGQTEQDTLTDIWVMHLPSGARPFANLGQPNQLATLQLWAVIGLIWGWHRGALRGWMVVAGGALLVLGLALTQSRTAWLSLFVLVALACVWRQRPFGRQMLGAIAGLYLLYLAVQIALPYVADWLELAPAGTMTDRLQAGMSSELRFPAWKMFLDASLQSPWIGYGWGHTRDAMLAVIPSHPALAGQPFGHAHMLALDLILWVGWPLGMALILLVGWWVWMQCRSIQSADQALVFAAVLVVGIHAMLEFPLHYAYFLLPTGIFIGVLNAQAPATLKWFEINKRWLVAASVCATLLLAAIIRDYLEVERAFNELRFESQRVGTTFNRQPPDTLVLHQWRDFIELARMEPRAGMTQDELDHLRAVTLYFPAVRLVDRYMHALSLNGASEELQQFRARLCAIMDKNTCQFMSMRWASGVLPQQGLAGAAYSESSRVTDGSASPAASAPVTIEIRTIR